VRAVHFFPHFLQPLYQGSRSKSRKKE
jgi:hypothetical protein